MSDAILEDEDLRYMTVTMLLEPDARDKQRRVGASDLSNNCDRCLALSLLGVEVYNPRVEDIWLSAEIGTALHGHLEHLVKNLRGRPGFPQLHGAKAERHLTFGHINGYGDVAGTIDLSLIGQGVDWKGTSRKKTALLRDYLATQRGEEPPFGRTSPYIKLSERQYADEMARMVHKVNGYYAQQTLYMRGLKLAGEPVRKWSIIWINRDGNGIFDRPGSRRYDDPTAMHDIWVQSFTYDEQYALALLDRAQVIWDALEAGATPADFPQAEACWPCSIEREQILRDADVIEATLAA